MWRYQYDLYSMLSKLYPPYKFIYLIEALTRDFWCVHRHPHVCCLCVLPCLFGCVSLGL